MEMYICHQEYTYNQFLDTMNPYIETRDSVTTSEAHLSAILEVRFKLGSTIFATSSTDKTVKLWDAKRVSLFVFISPSTHFSALVLPL
jgi:WD40 repeat protein